MIDIITVSLIIFFCFVVIMTLKDVCNKLNCFLANVYYSFVVGFCAAGLMSSIAILVSAIK